LVPPIGRALLRRDLHARMKSTATRAAANAPPAPQSAASISRSIRCQSLQSFQQCRDGHNDSPDNKRPWPGETEKQCDSKIANEVVELPTKLGAWGPFGRAERGDQKQNYNDPAANLCAGTKSRFQFGHSPPPSSPETRAGKYGNCSLFNRNMQKTVLGAPGEAHVEKVQMEGT